MHGLDRRHAVLGRRDERNRSGSLVERPADLLGPDGELVLAPAQRPSSTSVVGAWAWWRGRVDDLHGWRWVSGRAPVRATSGSPRRTSSQPSAPSAGGRGVGTLLRPRGGLLINPVMGGTMSKRHRDGDLVLPPRAERRAHARSERHRINTELAEVAEQVCGGVEPDDAPDPAVGYRPVHHHDPAQAKEVESQAPPASPALEAEDVEAADVDATAQGPGDPPGRRRALDRPHQVASGGRPFRGVDDGRRRWRPQREVTAG